MSLAFGGLRGQRKQREQGREEIPLAMLGNGEKGKIVSIVGGAGAHRNLMDLGIIEGKDVKVIKNSGGAVLVAVNGTRLVVGRGLALKVLVRVENGNNR